jgi:signal transduction histidine kinase/CheY-like chemotaxis protein
LLNSTGIAELLEQDERPTFIVDLGDANNYGEHSPLHLLYANPTLRSYDGLQNLCAGAHPPSSSPGQDTFLPFKVWLLSAAVNGESLNVCLPPFTYASLTWNCSTVRRRLRVLSGVFSPSASAALESTRRSLPPGQKGSNSEVASEPTDYFGGARLAAAGPTSDSPSSLSTEVVSTIEPMQSTATPSSIPLPTSGEADIPSTDASPFGHSLAHSSSALNGAIPREHMNDAEQHALSRLQHEQLDAPCFDWTRLPVSDNMPEHIKFARSIDWASTSLGPIEDWSPDLRQMCNLIMASPHPAAMYWGDDLIAIYNEAYVVLAGQKHPALMGMSYHLAWVEIWDEVKDVFANARSTGEATMKDDDCLFVRRSDLLEETYFSWSIIPMVGSDGSVMGLYNPAFEKTRRKIAERRMLTLREVGERTASARDVKGFWGEVLASLALNEYDCPFLLLYSVTDDMDSDTSSMHSSSTFAGRQCILEGALGVPEDHFVAPAQIDFKTGQEGFGPIFREVMKTNKPVLLEASSHALPKELLAGLEPRGFGDPLKAVLVCPVYPTTTAEVVLGFLVLGVNPRRPYDDDYSLFVQLLARQLATSLASVVLFEEEIRRGQKAAQLAALDRIELSEQLAARTQEAMESETKFTRMAEFAPVGMFIAGSDGKITFANDTWYEISRVSKTAQGPDEWMNAIMPEDKAYVDSLWHDLVVNTKSVNGEFRFKAPWHSRTGIKSDTWVLFSCYPETYDDGRLKSIFGVITEISQQKWAEGLQTRRMEEAVELKRQQENFIDMTSHEMRNPLSAILQCSDEIETSLTHFKNSSDTVMSEEVLAGCLDAAQTIRLCSQHQKRIVDDILTLSKLDSQLLLVTPVDARPLDVVERALKMHEGELQANDIQMKFVVDISFRDMKLDWVRFDPSRVLQVLINLTTNAIKFTSPEKRRTITVTIAASKEKPSTKPDAPVQYFPTRNKNKDAMKENEWGNGELVYILFSVRDTGRGLNPEEKKLLFMRFSQASPRTHVQYGGSGLGLFISRELTELQGGEIGVESEAGKGSIFSFYVAARRTTAPLVDTDGATGQKRIPMNSDARTTKTTSRIQSAGQTPTPEAAAAAANLVRKVLIVEDNLVNQRVLQKQLKGLGTEVHLANHGGEALERLMQSRYWKDDRPATEKLDLGVILMDQEMPIMDGLTCTRRIRELEAQGKLTGHVPIIAVTANARPEQVQTAMDAGMVSYLTAFSLTCKGDSCTDMANSQDDVVSKPFRIPELMPKIEELLARYAVK